LDEIFKQTSLGKTADEIRMHVEWRRPRPGGERSSGCGGEEATESARTDLEKRKRLAITTTLLQTNEALAGARK